MIHHVIQCLVIPQKGSSRSNLEAALGRSHYKLKYQCINNSTELQQRLKHLPALLFCPDTMGELQRNQLSKVLYTLAPDCIVAFYSGKTWEGFSKDASGITTCAITTDHSTELQRQLDYLLAYAQMKAEFRHCKHLLSIVEQRNQWLVEYSREAVAYILGNQHLYVNAAYMHLFGFDTELGALNASVLKLVLPSHQEAFTSLSRESEKKASLPNKFLLNMRSSKKKVKPFRAEVRFIPAVFRGQRCIQLHVHPLLDATAKKGAKQVAADPWKVRIPVIPNKTVKKTVCSGEKPAVSAPVSGVGSRNALKVDFKELLNLKGSENPAMFMVQPYLKQSGGKVSGKQLAAKLNARSRQKVDAKSLEVAARYLHKRFDQPLKHMVWVELADWVLTDSNSLEWLLSFLNKNRKINQMFVISLDADSCIRLRDSAVNIFPRLQSTGVRIALGGIRQLTPEV